MQQPRMQPQHVQGMAAARSAEPSRANRDADLPPLPTDPALGQHLKVGSAPGLLKRMTTKLRSPVIPPGPSSKAALSPPTSFPPGSAAPSSSNTQDAPASDNGKAKRKAILRLPPMPKGPPNNFTSAEHRQAALRAVGLLPAVPHPYKDSHGYMIPLSEQERVLDSRFTVLAEQPQSRTDERDSEAKKIREAWLARNRENQAVSPVSPAQPSLDTGDIAIGRERSRQGMLLEAHSPAPLSLKAVLDGSAPRSAVGAPEDDVQDAALSALLEKQLSESDDVCSPADTALSVSPKSVSVGVSSRAPAVPRKDRPAISPPSSPSSDATERVSRWLQLSTSTPAQLASSFSPLASSSPDSEPSSGSLPSVGLPEQTRSSTKERIDKLASIIVTVSPGSDSPSSAELYPPASAPAGSYPGSLDSDDTAGYTLRPLVPPPRGRSATMSHASRAKAHPVDTAEMSLGSRSNNLPALSPTRTVSSSGASMSVTTPTTASHSAESQGHRAPPRRPPGLHLTAPELSVLRGTDARVVIAESPAEEDRSSAFPGSAWEEVGMPPAHEGKRAMTLGVFTRRSDDTSRAPRPARSMLNMRRAVTQKLQLRPKSGVVPSASSPTALQSPGARPAPSAFLAPHNPPRRYASSESVTTASDRSRTVSVGLRTREALSPTMHSRATILREAGRIEDEESRRLSEMAFLDY